MKLNHVISPRLNGRVIRQFGEATLLRHRNGQHQLVGGTRADRTAAVEWVSLFAHEIVFTHIARPADGRCRQNLPAVRMQAACP
jgi:hypothetical protein